MNSTTNFSTIIDNSTIDHTYPDHCKNLLKIIVLVASAITTVIGFVGNTMTIIGILATKKYTKSVATCFILNLAIADDLFIFGLPFQAYTTYKGKWIFGEAMCQIHKPVYGLNLFVSIYTMVVMSVDRYIAVREPLWSIGYKTSKKALIICIIIWILCFIIVTPMWYFAVVNRSGSCQSDINKMGSNGKLAWDIIQLILGLILPLLVVIICYSRLVRHLVTERQVILGQAPSHIKRVTFMVLLVTVIFIVCWTPWHMMNFMFLVPREHIVANICTFQAVNVVAQILVFISSCCNPFIYWISSGTCKSMYHAALQNSCTRRSKHRCIANTSYRQTGSTRDVIVRYRNGNKDSAVDTELVTHPSRVQKNNV